MYARIRALLWCKDFPVLLASKSVFDCHMSPTSLFKVVNGLRHFGKGCKVTRDIYKLPNTYWVVKDTKLSKDQEHGKVYGQLVWNGRLKEKVEEIGCVNKKQWSLVSTPDYGTYKADQEAA